jgi:polyhydroxyalkanoate synthesis regulator phasin
MFEVLKQSIFSSIGLASLTQEKIADIVAEVTKKIPLSEQQAKEFQEEVGRRSDEARQQLGKQIDSQIDHAFIQMGLLKAEARKTTESISDGLQRLIDDRISDALSRLGIAKAEDIAALTSRIELLEQKIAKNS